MTASGNRDDLERRLHKFSERLDHKLKELQRRPQHTSGQHMGHLVDFREESEQLKRQLAQSGGSGAGSAHDTVEANFNSLLDRFNRWIRYVDDEYNQTR